MPQGLTLEQAQKLGFKPKGITLEEATAKGFTAKPAEDLDAIRAAQAAKFPSSQEQGRGGAGVGGAGAVLRGLTGGAEGYGAGTAPVHSPLETLKSLPGAAKEAMKLAAMPNTEIARRAATGQEIPDPAGVKPVFDKVNEGDYAGAAGYGLGALGGALTTGYIAKNAPKAAKAAGESAGGKLRTSAANDFKKILNPTTKPNKFTTEKVAPELAQRGIKAATEGRLRLKVAEAKITAGKAVDAAWDALPDNARISKQPLLDAIDGIKKKFSADGVEVLPEAGAKLDQLRSVIDQFGDEIAPSSLRKVRQLWDTIVDQSSGFGGKDLKATSETFAQRQVANVIRREIGNKYPNIKGLNAEFNFWANVDEILNAKALRDTGKSSRLRDLMAGSTGAIAGSHVGGIPGGIVGGVGIPLMLEFMQSTAWRTTSAGIKIKIADLISKGNVAEAVKYIPPSRQLTAGARQMPADTASSLENFRKRPLNVTTGEPLKRSYDDILGKYGKAKVASGPAKGMVLDFTDVDPMTGKPNRYVYVDLQTGRRQSFTTPQK